jgi:hypothetical protein
MITEKESHMNSVTLPGATALVTKNLSRFLARLDRPALEAVAQAAIDQLDSIDGDADQEDGDHDMCAASDDCGTGMTWLNPGDRLVGDPEDAENDDDAGNCAHFGISQMHAVGAASAFTSLNEMSATEMSAATMPLIKRRLDGKPLSSRL